MEWVNLPMDTCITRYTKEPQSVGFLITSLNLGKAMKGTMLQKYCKPPEKQIFDKKEIIEWRKLSIHMDTANTRYTKDPESLNSLVTTLNLRKAMKRRLLKRFKLHEKQNFYKS